MHGTGESLRFFSSLYLDFSHHWQLEWYPARVNYFESRTTLGLFNTIFKIIEFFIRLLHSKSTKISKLYIISISVAFLYLFKEIITIIHKHNNKNKILLFFRSICNKLKIHNQRKDYKIII